jgi:hypothetical protein
VSESPVVVVVAMCTHIVSTPCFTVTDKISADFKKKTIAKAKKAAAPPKKKAAPKKKTTAKKAVKKVCLCVAVVHYFINERQSPHDCFIIMLISSNRPRRSKKPRRSKR